MARTKLDDKGRISIPASLRRQLGLNTHDEVVIERQGSLLVLRKEAPEIPTVNSHGGWKRKPVLTGTEALVGQ
ncbi:MAG: AbrB/MazE/SpoVT family DNA-binding domain-containing protein [Candidatus Thermoplasmatota archaeon]|nr:AbrB/MazE/SpoVT family DNA-binding domain-containing protein [Candidatus Thermoplasmatota archaeon]